MPAKVVLTVAGGPLQGQTFVLDERTTCIVGRADDCQPRLPTDEQHKTLSRHHCLLDVNPPDVRVRDFGSLNGTFVNGEKIGQREKGQTPEQAALGTFPERDLKDGDTIELGNTVFRVGIVVPAVCAGCGAEIPEDRTAKARTSPGLFQCEACQLAATAPVPEVTAAIPDLPAPAPDVTRTKAKACAGCGRDVAGEAGANRHGEFVCAACQADPAKLLRRLIEQANTGARDLVAIRGYSVLRELGRGGMGAVYLARHDATGEQAALKVMLPRVAVDARAREMFLREVENTKALLHSRVVRLRDSGCSNGTFFFTLEYCEGSSVDRLLKETGGTFPLAEAAAIILQALDGLEYAHGAAIPCVKRADGGYGPGHGLVHRDVKPHNLFLAGTGAARVAKVGDFGLAKAFDTAGLSGQTRTGSVAGTPVFMPRQQVVNFKYAKPEVDVWAAAASFYYMLTGRPPRDFAPGKDPWQVVLQTDAVPIRRRMPTVPERLAEVIDRALIDRPTIGFATASEFKKALEATL